jgi:ribokinase
MSIVVLGSLNMDLVVEAPRLPLAGETLRGTRFHLAPGGKGANQAVAAARQGARVAIVGCVGSDDFGPRLVASLNDADVDTGGVSIDPGAPTGVASIVVGANGENQIVTVGGANHRVGRADLHALDGHLADASMLLVQLEIPMDVVAAAVRRARARGVGVLLDPAPVAPLPDTLYADVEWITPNVVETQVLTGIAPLTESDARRAGECLRERGVEHVAITLGAEGCFYTGAEGSFRVAAPPVDAIDAVGAGDAFAGALAAALTGGEGVGTALERAVAAGALATTKRGAQPSLPTAADVDVLLRSTE